MTRGVKGAALAAALLLLGATSGCKLDEVGVPKAEPQIVVHAVLDPFTDDELVLVEQTLSGEVSVPDRTASDSLDPIISGGGVPIRDATVILRNLDSATEVIGIEDASTRPDGKGQGVYRFQNRPRPMFPPILGNEITIHRGGRYSLEVRWRGLTARAHTTVPNPNSFYPQILGTRIYNVDHDTLLLKWDEAQARRFVLQAETPYGPFRLFAGQQQVVVRGALRNLFVNELPPVFIPGFLEVVSTAAVDTNYFDYFRSASNPFTGAGLLNHVEGGVGVFGSVVRLDTRRLEVTADMNELPIEGHFVGDGPSGTETLDLYLGEVLGNDVRRVSGVIRGTDFNGEPTRRSILGVAMPGNKLVLALLRGSYADDTLVTATGVAAGDSVMISYPGIPTVIYRRAAPAVASAALVEDGAPLERRERAYYARPQRASSRWHSAHTP